MRVHLFEFEDQSWFPNAIREGGTDFLRYFLTATQFYKPVPALITKAIRQTGDKQLVDLCSGGGGPVESIYSWMKEEGTKVKVTLSDKFPNAKAYRYLRDKTNGEIDFYPRPVDAANVPRDLEGFRVMFSAVHHFHPPVVKQILKDAVDQNRGIALFDGGDKNPFTVLGILLFHPVAFVLCTPFFRPFRFSRLLFTYLLPFIPLYTIWDGIVSILRLYKPAELLKLAQEAGPNYHWEAGKAKNKLGLRVTYLMGYPKK